MTDNEIRILRQRAELDYMLAKNVGNEAEMTKQAGLAQDYNKMLLRQFPHKMTRE
jgi:hypothetical protein